MGVSERLMLPRSSVSPLRAKGNLGIPTTEHFRETREYTLNSRNLMLPKHFDGSLPGDSRQTSRCAGRRALAISEVASLRGRGG